VQEAAWEEEEQDEVEDMEEEVEHDDDDDQEEAAAETVEKGQGSSYGYLEAVARYSAHELLGITLPRRLAYSTSRHAGSDIRELVIRVRGKVASGAGGGGGGGDGGEVRELRFAAMYGFRNIQTLVNWIEARECAYHYVEVCVGGLVWFSLV
jgi:hypothetical protein